LDTAVGIITLAVGVGNNVVGWSLFALTVALINTLSGQTHVSRAQDKLHARGRIGMMTSVYLSFPTAFFINTIKIDAVRSEFPLWFVFDRTLDLNASYW
jgi:hypothetical protein